MSARWVGKVIGRAGRTAKALRTVVGALGPGRGVRVDFLDAYKKMMDSMAR